MVVGNKKAIISFNITKTSKVIKIYIHIFRKVLESLFSNFLRENLLKIIKQFSKDRYTDNFPIHLVCTSSIFRKKTDACCFSMKLLVKTFNNVGIHNYKEEIISKFCLFTTL